MTIETTKGSGPRFYFDTDNPAVKYPGVTSIVGMLPKPFLTFWAAKMAAELAVDSLEFVEQLMERGGRPAAVQYISGASRRYTKERSDIGSEAHDLFERMIRGQNVGFVSRDMAPYERQFGEFLDAVQPELVRAEQVAWSPTHKYAGSFDGMLRLRLDERGKPDPQGEPALVIADWKTGKSTYPDVALQMAAYAHADQVISPDGVAEPMPEFDGAVVLHITPDVCALKPVRIDKADVFAQFLHLRETFEWDRVTSKSVLGDPIWSAGGEIVTGTQRRAAR